jgi:hypothetical protein
MEGMTPPALLFDEKNGAQSFGIFSAFGATFSTILVKVWKRGRWIS